MNQHICIFMSVAICLAAGEWGRADDKVNFRRDIRPLLSDRCFDCHGPSDEDRQAALRFDTDEGDEGPFRDRGGYQAVMPHDLEASAVWTRVTTSDPELRMPPVGSHHEPLSDEEQELFKRWIEQGANYEKFWAFVAPERQVLPQVTRGSWLSNRVDSFVLSRIETEGIQPQKQASRRTLIRRMTFDLTGLPPSREEIHTLLQDTSDVALERLADRLLAKPHYGEHMAKYWLDLVRFADTSGMHHDHYREMTAYRDWIIRSLNDNLPYDDFLSYQIAGDLYPEPILDQQIASGFHRLHLVIDAGTALPEESFHRNVVDRVTAFGTALLGLTVQCANCHDHKYDPLTQEDFYQLYAFFNNIDASPETPGSSTHTPFVLLPSAEQTAQLAQVGTTIHEATAWIKDLKHRIADVGQKADEDTDERSAKTDALAAELAAAEKHLEQLNGHRNAIQSQIPVTLVMKERPEVRPTHIRIRGAYDQLGAQVGRDTPQFLPPMSAAGDVKTRLDLAEWVTDAGNPLVARVAANRCWQQFFGVGLVKTSEDFGGQGEWPSHPELLDELAVELLRSEWDVKLLIRSLVTSATYRQSSQADPTSFTADPENRLLARGPRFRLDSEMIRDQILANSGQLVSTMYGKSVKPPQPPGLWKSVSMVSSSTYAFTADAGEKIYRRSLYSFWKRAMPPPQMTILDAPTRESCTARRERTNTPLQALLMMNEQQYFQAARQLALRLLADTEQTTTDRIEVAYETVTSQLPDDEELTALQVGLAAFQTVYENDVASAEEMTADLKSLNDQQRIEVAAFTMLTNTLLNLDITKNRE